LDISAIVKFGLGLVLAVGTLRDVFDTVVVPGESRGALKAARRIVFATLPLWRWSRRGRGGIATSFAPFALVASFVVWMLLLTFGFGLMAHALRDSFQPRLPSFPQALYVAGSALVTVGQSEGNPVGSARWLSLAAGFCGLAVMTMAVTYLLEVQGSIAARDAGILKLYTSSGEPPSGLALLERYAELGCVDQIPLVLRDGRDWCATVLQSHAAHPSLIYFRSRGTGSGWPATLGALMDLALTIEMLLDAPQWRGSAVLLREQGGRMAQTLIELVGLDHGPAPPSAEEVEALLSRLAAAGYAIRETPDREGFCAQRGRYAGCTSRMAQHLAGEQSPLIP
jgi:hypothetical protein